MNRDKTASYGITHQTAMQLTTILFLIPTETLTCEGAYCFPLGQRCFRSTFKICAFATHLSSLLNEDGFWLGDWNFLGGFSCFKPMTDVSPCPCSPHHQERLMTGTLQFYMYFLWKEHRPNPQNENANGTYLVVWLFGEQGKVFTYSIGLF